MGGMALQYIIIILIIHFMNSIGGEKVCWTVTTLLIYHLNLHTKYRMLLSEGTIFSSYFNGSVIKVKYTD